VVEGVAVVLGAEKLDSVPVTLDSFGAGELDGLVGGSLGVELAAADAQDGPTPGDHPGWAAI